MTLSHERQQRKHARRAAVGAMVGTTIEWYDFFIYSTSAALVLGQVFFPSHNHTASLLGAFSTFFVAFAARPVGAILFGHLGDRFGRKKILITTLMLMGASTVSIGLIPGYASWGAWAPTLLVLARVIQGISVGGEWGGAVVLSVEHARSDSKTWLGSWPQWGSPLGLLLSTAVIALATSLPGDAYYEWAWRLPFLLSIVLFIVGLVIRAKIEESPEFVQPTESSDTRSTFPLTLLLWRHWLPLLLGIGAFAYSLGGYYLTTTYTVSYIESELHLPTYIGLSALVIAAFAQLGGSIVGALLADRSERMRRNLMLGALGLLIPFAFAFFPLINTQIPAAIYGAIAISQVLQGLFYGPAAAMIVHMFPPTVRFTGVSLSYQFSAVLLGATAPFVATLLVTGPKGSVLLACYLALMAVISFVSVFWCLRITSYQHSTSTYVPHEIGSA
ncbi:MFS transporter [Brevibacterium aurantiacum]|uniref:MFS transporter n=1 Tax=Brevibacterium aurantiacum TaxID=273384 RepID=UPI0018665A5E|nr:MFS transporter [Brevibacterium aurantiacum]